MAGYSDEVHHAISVLFQAGIREVEKGTDLEKFQNMVDAVGDVFVGDDQQKSFYSAIKSLSESVSKTD